MVEATADELSFIEFSVDKTVVAGWPVDEPGLVVSTVPKISMFEILRVLSLWKQPLSLYNRLAKPITVEEHIQNEPRSYQYPTAPRLYSSREHRYPP
jgi:hypothetical protein